MSEEDSNSKTDWRVGCGNSQLHDGARKRNLFSDLEIEVGNEETSYSRIFYLHKFMLACASPVFENMFFGSEAEDSLELPEDDPDTFELLLKFIYREHVQIGSIIRGWKLHNMAIKYQIPEAQRLAKDYCLAYNLVYYDFWEILKYNLFFDPLFKNSIDAFLLTEMDDIINSKKFMRLPEGVVKSILQNDIMNIDECDLLEAVTTWAYSKYGNDADSKTLRPYLQHIRFAVLTKHDFCAFTEEYPKAIDFKSSLEILKHLTYERYKLPKWCSPIRLARIRTIDKPESFSEEGLSPQSVNCTVERRIANS